MEQSASVFRVAADEGAQAPKPNSILSEAMLKNADVKVVRFGFAEGQELSEHTASVPALIHQVSGRAVWTLGAEQREATPGDWAYMPPNMKHAIKAESACVLLLVMIQK